MSFFKKSPEFKFYSAVPGVCDEYPIVKSSAHDRKWIKPAVSAFKEKVDNLDNYDQPVIGIAKCPGVFDIMNIGWIVPAWCDFIIETNCDEQTINWRTPAMLEGITCGEAFNKPAISFMSTVNPTMAIPMKKEDNPFLVKVNTPWVVDIPKGWALMICPVTYSDDTRFESTTGIITPSTHMEINPQLYWKVKHGKQLVKAGTPLCQLIPIKLDNTTFSCSEFSSEQLKNQKKMYFKRASTYIRKNNVTRS